MRTDGMVGRSLVIGGTGMLAAATHWLATRSEQTIIVARRASRFRTDGAVLAIDADWGSADFPERVMSGVQRGSPVVRALLWLHEPEPTLAWLLPLLPEAVTVLVLGSMSGRPALPKGVERLVTVRLGSQATCAGGRRWLTDEEISTGAVAAFRDGQSRVVGELTPVA